MKTIPSVTHDFQIGKNLLKISDYATSDIAIYIYRELLLDSYQINRIKFFPGDTIIDIGAHIGFVSIYIAKQYPFVKIYAYEPIPDNYKHLVKNIKINSVVNVIPINQALTKDGRNIDMIVNFYNSGGATGCLKNMKLEDHNYYKVKSTTLDKVFKKYFIKKCKFLKIDCEGAEHEILLNCASLNKVEYLSGEFHINQNLSNQGYSIDSLIKYCAKYIEKGKLCISSIKMAE